MIHRRVHFHGQWARIQPLLFAGALGLAALGFAAEPTPQQRADREQLRRLLPACESWEKWLQTSGELPPDFDKLPSIPFLPDPLRFNNGNAVATPEQWPQRRLEILRMFSHYVFGTLPAAPGNVRAADVKTREEGGATVQELVLEFGPQNQAKLHVELIIPKGAGPFPVFITQDNHRAWALVAVSRGYLGCVYAGADSRDDTGGFVPLYPQFDWTKLARRAWAASRCVDYLHTLDLVDRAKIALTGHSRNGKLSLIAAALDERITAVISSSAGAGGPCTYRLFSETQFGEGIENITRVFPDWFHPRLRFFAGRENKLPIDQHELIACIAPRPCLISSALNDSVESLWAIEQTYYSARRVYQLFNQGDELNLRYRPGGHETRAEDIESYVDWLDSVFGRADHALPNAVVYPTYAEWQKLNPAKIETSHFPPKGIQDLLRGEQNLSIDRPEEWQLKKPDLRARILWGLGEAPPFAESAAGSYGAESLHLATLLGRATVPEGLQKRSLNFGNYLAGDLYFPANADRAGKKLPVVIWLHPMSGATGYTAGYRRGEQPHLALARLGCAVFAFDQIGNGARVEEVRNFYQRYPQWSLLGKQVEDTLAAVEALQKLSYIDPQRIYVFGYATGAMAALHAAALDERIAGVVSVAGFTPMRLDTPDKGTGGIARWSQWLPWQPRLGAFLGQETRIPYDYHEVLAMVAPRPALVALPRLDYHSTRKDLDLCLAEVGKVFSLLGGPDKLQILEIDDYNHFSPELQKTVFEQFKRLAGF